MSDVEAMQGLFETLRESCSRGNWSRGVELARGGFVMGERDEGDQVVLRVSSAGTLVSRTVALYLSDEDWSCDCSSQEDVCEHAAAAVIALRRARQAGEALPKAPSSVAQLRYLFKRAQGALLFERVFVKADQVEPLPGSLAAISAGRIRGPAFMATPADLAVELVLGAREPGWMPREVMAKLIDKLVDCGDVRLDGQPVKLSSERIGMIARLVDQSLGFRLSVAQHPSITELFSNGVALCADTLRAVAEPKLNGRELQEYGAGRYFSPNEFAELTTRLLPALRERIDVDIQTKRLPRVSNAKPRIAIETRREKDALSVLATLVYGEPPVARIDAGDLVLLGRDTPQRDEEQERRLVRQLQTQLGLSPGRREAFPAEHGVEMAERLRRWQGSVDGAGHQAFFRAQALVPRVRVDGERFEVEFESPGAAQGKVGRADPSAVLRAWREGTSMVPLLEGGWAPLPADWLARYGRRIADLLAAKEGRQALPTSALPDLARLCADLGQPPPPRFAELKPLLEGFQTLPPPQLPGDLSAELRHYQRDGVAWLSFLRQAKLGALLADDMGLGKTLQALCAVEAPALVVAPTSVVFNWAAEAARFRPSLRVCVYHGPQRAFDPKADVTLTSYALLRIEADAFAARHWKTVVLDEAQAIKNPDSQVARAAYRLDADARVAMTGTPVENRLEELWSELHFLNPGLLGGRSDFDDRYAKPIAAGEDGAAARLRERIKPFVLRRLKREVAPELPPRTEMVLRCLLSDPERELYQSIFAATRAEVVEKLQQGGNVIAALEALLRLRQACCHPGLIPGQSAESSAKVDVLLENLQEAAADGHKSLVFSQWTSLLDLIEPRLKAEGLAFTRLDGSTRDREGVVQGFQRDDGPPVMLISLKAGGAGLNLTAADHVFLVDPWWNPAVEDQAADRTHRIGQTKPVLVHRLVALDTVEERILALQREKRALAEAALSGAGQGASLSREDLLALLQ